MHTSLSFLTLLIVLLSNSFSLTLVAQWRTVESPPDRIFAITQHQNRLFAASEDTGLWESSNGGQTWQRINTPLFEMTFDASGFAHNENTLWAGFRGGGVCRSTDGGRTWQSFNGGFQSQAFVAGIVHIGDTLFAAVENAFGLQPGGIYRTEIGNPAWVRFGTGIPTTVPEFSGLHKTASHVLIAPSSNNGTRRGNIYVSEDFGRTWHDRRIADAFQVFSIQVIGNIIYAGTSNGIYRSDDNCKTWVHIGLQGKQIDRLLVAGTNSASTHAASIYAAVDGEGVFFNDNGGLGFWYALTQNLPIDDDFVSALYVHNNRLFAALSARRGLWSMPLTTVGVKRDAEIIGVSLGTAFPQPASHEVQCMMNLSQQEEITVTLHDVLGQQLATIKEREMLSAGQHIIAAQTQHLPAGVYVLRVRAGQKMFAQPFVHSR